jgi:conjugative transfer signal peptidase TraF
MKIWLLLVLSALVVLDSSRLFYFNIFTHSLPYGVYMRVKGGPQRGDYAASCLTSDIAQYGIDRQYLAQGNCLTGTVGVLKIIKGLPGDRFSVKNGFLELNGNVYSIMEKDSSGRTLKVFYKQREGILGKGEYMLLSDFVQNSWDSRYWGPVNIQFLLKPFWTFENKK